MLVSVDVHICICVCPYKRHRESVVQMIRYWFIRANIHFLLTKLCISEDIKEREKETDMERELKLQHKVTATC